MGTSTQTTISTITDHLVPEDQQEFALECTVSVVFRAHILLIHEQSAPAFLGPPHLKV